MKNQITFFSKKGYFNLMRFSQNLFLKSLSSRLKYVHESLLNLNDDFFYNFFNFISEERWLLVFSLKNIFFVQEFQSFISIKNKGFSFFFNFPLIYNLTAEALINSSLLCALDFHSDKRCFGFKPFRDSSDIFFEIKSSLVRKFKNYGVYFINKNVLNFRKISDNSWLLKNLCFERKILNSWFIFQSKSFEHSRLVLKKTFFNELYFTLLNFLLYGLLWILI